MLLLLLLLLLAPCWPRPVGCGQALFLYINLEVIDECGSKKRTDVVNLHCHDHLGLEKEREETVVFIVSLDGLPLFRGYGKIKPNDQRRGTGMVIKRPYFWVEESHVVLTNQTKQIPGLSSRFDLSIIVVFFFLF